MSYFSSVVVIRNQHVLASLVLCVFNYDIWLTRTLKSKVGNLGLNVPTNDFIFYTVKRSDADCLTSFRVWSVVYFVLLAIISAMGVIAVKETFSDLHSRFHKPFSRNMLEFDLVTLLFIHSHIFSCSLVLIVFGKCIPSAIMVYSKEKLVP